MMYDRQIIRRQRDGRFRLTAADNERVGVWEGKQMKEENLRKLQEILDRAVADKEIAGANFCVQKDGREICYLQSGYGDMERKKELRRDSIFRLYSMTKPITAAAVMKLAEEGRLDMGEPVAAFFPSFRGQTVEEKAGERVPVQRDVTVKDLMDMTAGLMYPGYAGPAGKETDKVFVELDRRLFTEHPMSTEEFAECLGKCPLAFQPGSGWMYSSCADVLGAIVEKVSGVAFSRYLRENFFEPLGMADTGFYVPEEKRERLAVTYQTGMEGMEPYRGNHLGIINAMDREPAFASGGAGLVSTVDDYMRFAHMLLQGGIYDGGRVLEEHTVRFMVNGGLLRNQQLEMEKQFTHIRGYTYSNLLRILQEEGKALHMGQAGEYGWDGWLGCYFSNDPGNGISIVFMTQRKDAGTLPVLRKMKNVLYASCL